MTDSEQPWKTNQDFEYTYKRKEGDLVVYAPNEKRALETISQHGFTNLDPKMLYKSGPSLQELLEKKGRA